MRWDARIDEMEKRGHQTEEEWFDLTDWATCFVGESLQEAGAPEFNDLDRGLSVRLFMLGSGAHPEGSPNILCCAHKWAALRARLAEIREVVAQHYPPPILWEPSEQAAERELLEVK